MPLDPKPPVYHITIQADDADLPSGRAVAERANRETYMVSHFATCPKADMFSASKR